MEIASFSLGIKSDSGSAFVFGSLGCLGSVRFGLLCFGLVCLVGTFVSLSFGELLDCRFL